MVLFRLYCLVFMKSFVVIPVFFFNNRLRIDDVLSVFTPTPHPNNNVISYHHTFKNHSRICFRRLGKRFFFYIVFDSDVNETRFCWSLSVSSARRSMIGSAKRTNRARGGAGITQGLYRCNGRDTKQRSMSCIRTVGREENGSRGKTTNI